jgi:hypothetical protein
MAGAEDRAFLLEPPVFFEGSPGVVALAAADLDGDGDVDIAASIPEGPEILLYENLGNGRFERRAVVAGGATALAASDLDGDGVIDLATASSGVAAISVFHGAGNGDLLERVQIASVQDPTTLTVGDVDRNGLPDLVVPIKNFCNCVHIYLNAGERRFEDARIASTGTGVGVGLNPTDAALLDVDADGWLDMAVANFNGFAVSLFPNLGVAEGGGWSGLGARQDLRLDGHQTSIAGGDLDGDGLGELAVLFAGGVSLFRNRGSEGFAPPELLLETEDEPLALEMTDLDRDESLDLVIADTEALRITVALNDGSGAFTKQSSDQVSNRPVGLVTADFDAGGAVDVAVTHSGVAVFLNTLGEDCNRNDVPDAVDLRPTLAFAEPESRTISRDGRVEAGDVDADGDMEIVLGFPGNGGFPPRLSVLPNLGDGTFAPPLDREMELEFRAFRLGDVDGDGKLDVLANLLIAVRTLLGDGTGRFRDGLLLPDAGSFISPLVDIDRDGDLDLVAAAFREDVMVIILNDGTGRFGLGQRLATPSTPWEAAAADLDGDADLDLAVANRTTGNVSIFLNEGAASFARGAPPPPGPPGEPCGPDEPPVGPRGDLGCDVYSSC